MNIVKIKRNVCACGESCTYPKTSNRCIRKFDCRIDWIHWSVTTPCSAFSWTRIMMIMWMINWKSWDYCEKSTIVLPSAMPYPRHFGESEWSPVDPDTSPAPPLCHGPIEYMPHLRAPMASAMGHLIGVSIYNCKGN